MSTRAKWLMATAVGAALIVPGVVLASGGPSGSFSAGPSNTAKFKFSSSGGTVRTQGKGFKTIPGMTLPDPAEFYARPVTVEISADMVGGTAKFRVIADEFVGPTPQRSNAPLSPTTATFAAPGSNSFQFIEPGDPLTETAKDFDIQWKRVGNHRAKAAHVVMTLFGEPD